jgi:hypothetical protein
VEDEVHKQNDRTQLKQKAQDPHTSGLTETFPMYLGYVSTVAIAREGRGCGSKGGAGATPPGQGTAQQILSRRNP